MAEFLNTEKAYSEMVEIISKARNKLVLISPYIKIPPQLLERLKYTDGKGVKIIVVCREKDLAPEARSELKQLKNLELRFDENLHAKCFYNEESMVITSLNLYDYSQQHNREMGVLLSLKDDYNVFNEALNEARFIVGRAKKDSLIRSVFSEVAKGTKSIVDSVIKDEPSRPKISSYSHRTSSRQKGFCIRCKRRIPYNLDAPYCPTHFKVWARWKDSDYEEKFCHTCGRPAPTSKARPQCSSCRKRRI